MTMVNGAEGLRSPETTGSLSLPEAGAPDYALSAPLRLVETLRG